MDDNAGLGLVFRVLLFIGMVMGFHGNGFGHAVHEHETAQNHAHDNSGGQIDKDHQEKG